MKEGGLRNGQCNRLCLLPKVGLCTRAINISQATYKTTWLSGYMRVRLSKFHYAYLSKPYCQLLLDWRGQGAWLSPGWPRRDLVTVAMPAPGRACTNKPASWSSPSSMTFSALLCCVFHLTPEPSGKMRGVQNFPTDDKTERMWLLYFTSQKYQLKKRETSVAVLTHDYFRQTWFPTALRELANPQSPSHHPHRCATSEETYLC